VLWLLLQQPGCFTGRHDRNLQYTDTYIFHTPTVEVVTTGP
jgi:hypothetical protein